MQRFLVERERIQGVGKWGLNLGQDRLFSRYLVHLFNNKVPKPPFPHPLNPAQKMPVIKTTADDTIKKRFLNAAEKRGMKEASLMRALVMMVIEEDEGEGAAQRGEGQGEGEGSITRMTIRMPDYVAEGARKLAKKRGMKPSPWVAALVQSNVLAKPVLSEEELAILSASNRALAAIGRNINQIAKNLNAAFYDTEKVRISKLDELTKAIEENRAAIRDVVRASQNSWKAE